MRTRLAEGPEGCCCDVVEGRTQLSWSFLLPAPRHASHILLAKKPSCFCDTC